MAGKNQPLIPLQIKYGHVTFYDIFSCIEYAISRISPLNAPFWSWGLCLGILPISVNCSIKVNIYYRSK